MKLTSQKSATLPGWTRKLVYVQIAVQAGIALTPFYAVTVNAAASPFSSDRGQNQESSSLQSRVAGHASSVGQAMQSGDLRGMAAQQASGYATQQVQQWLNNFGTARIEFGTDSHFRPQSGAADLLLPLYKSDDRLFFTQNGVRNVDGQITGNFGLGQRHFAGDWMLGYNAFYDQNFSRGHKRAGAGAEAWRDYLKLSGNGYYRLSGWRDSRDVEDYDARPANGFDLRAEAWLPAYPALGGKLMYEKYYGDEVALFGKDKRQKNPTAITAGLSYTPVPLVSLSAEHKKGGSQNDTRFGMQLNYQLGQTLASQLDPANVALQRTLAGSAMDLVERNNNIVLEYRKKQLIDLVLPKEISGISGKTMPLSYQLTSKYALAKIQWNDAALTAAGGRIEDLGSGQYQIVLPKYVAGSINSYPLSAVAYDVRNNSSKVSATTVTVLRPAINPAASSVTASKDTMLADGRDSALITVTLTDEDNQPVSGMAAALKLSVKEEQANTIMKQAKVAAAPAQSAVISSISEQSAGVYTATLTAANRPALAVISTVVDGQSLPGVQVNQISDAATASIKDSDITLITNNAVANGSAVNEARARVTDATGNPVAGIAVNFKLSGNAQAAAGRSLNAVSDAEGYVTLQFTNLKAETVQLIAATAYGSGKISTVFIADAATASIAENDLSADRLSALANGKEKVTYSAVVKDANGNLVKESRVNWSTDGGELSAVSSVTESNGIAKITLTNTTAQIVQVQASVAGNAAVNAPKVSFGADPASGGIAAGDLTRDKASAVANGTELITYTVIVKDEHGNRLADQTVHWNSTLGTLSAATSKTDADGKASVTLQSTVAGAAILSAALALKPAVNAQSVAFVADSSTAAIDSKDIAVDRSTITANGTDKATFSAQVKDANGNPVAGQTVSWTTDGGHLSNSNSITDANGTATIVLTGTAMGNVQVNAAVNGSAEVRAPLVTLTADGSTAKIGSGDLNADKTSALANGTERVTYTALVKDAYGNPVTGALVNWSKDLGNLSERTSTTGAEGKATVTLTSPTAGSALVTAQTGSGSAVTAQPVSFIADAGSAVIGADDLTVDKTTAVANNLDAATYTALVKDANGNPVSGVTVNWSRDKGTISAGTSQTNAEGKATVALSHTKAESAQVTATLRGTGTSGPIVNFIADITTAKVDSLVSDKTRIIGTGVETATLTATITDANGNVITGFTPTWSSSKGDIVANGASSAEGKATATLTAPVHEATTDTTASVQAESKTASVAIRAVIKAGSAHYWTMYSQYPAATEALANSTCQAHGEGRAATLADLRNFATNSADFARMSVSGEYANNWYNLAGTWGTTSGDFHSAAAAVGATTSGAGTAYVCVK